MATATSDSEEIRRRMAHIRGQLHQDIHGVVRGAEKAADPMRWVSSYPWISLGLALGVGYLIVPKRRKTVVEVVAPAVAPAEAVRAATAAAPKGKPEGKAPGRGLLGGLFGLIGPVVVRVGQSYAAQYLETMLAAQQQQQMAAMMAATGARQPPPPGQGPSSRQPPPPGQGPSSRRV